MKTVALPAPRDELAERRAARAAHPAGGRTAAPTQPPPHPQDGVVRCPACGCDQWRTEWVRLVHDTSVPPPDVVVRVSACEEFVWCIDCGQELLLPEPPEET